MSPTMNFCSRCALPVNLNDEYTREMQLEQENDHLKEEIQKVREEMESKFQQILAKIDFATLK